MKFARSRGFSQIELSIVLATCFLLVSTALPQVLSVREGARQVQCMNNLKQLGLALHNYHDVYHVFPPGWVSRQHTGNGHLASGWMYSLLPYVDQAPLYNQLTDKSRTIFETHQTSALKKPLPIYRCPADSLPGTNPVRGGWGTSNYVGNYGATPIPRSSNMFANQDNWPGNQTSAFGDRQNFLRGFFQVNSRMAFRDVTDGTSNTIIVGERSVLTGGAIWPGVRSNFHEADAVADFSHASKLNESSFGFSSRHLNVINFLFADGSARNLLVEKLESRAYNRDPSKLGLLQKLGASSDGQAISF